MAREIAAAGYADLLVVSMLKGSFVFAADLIRAFHAAGISPEVEFLILASYRTGTVSTGEVKIAARRRERRPRARRAAHRRHSRIPAAHLPSPARACSSAAPAASASRAAREAGQRAQPLVADHVGFICPDLFVVGYGMDVAHAFRELPFVGVVED